MITRHCIHERIKPKGGSNGRKEQQGKARKYANSF